MGFKRFMSSFNAGGAKIDAVLHASTVLPGGTIAGVVNITGGKIDLDIQGIRLDLEAEVEVETNDSEHKTDMKFGGVDETQPFVLPVNGSAQLPFQLQVPWEAPLTQVYGRHLTGMKVGVRTKLQVAKAVDRGDMDPVEIAPLPSQQGILDAMGLLGFQFKSADLERGRLAGTANRHDSSQDLPFYQEIEFKPAPQFKRKIEEVELTFLTTAQSLTVVLEVDRRGGLLRSGHDAVIRFEIPHAQAMMTDFRGVLEAKINEKASGLGWFG
jgi:sporulation-control protein